MILSLLKVALLSTGICLNSFPKGTSTPINQNDRASINRKESVSYVDYKYNTWRNSEYFYTYAPNTGKEYQNDSQPQQANIKLSMGGGFYCVTNDTSYSTLTRERTFSGSENYVTYTFSGYQTSNLELCRYYIASNTYSVGWQYNYDYLFRFPNTTYSVYNYSDYSSTEYSVDDLKESFLNEIFSFERVNLNESMPYRLALFNLYGKSSFFFEDSLEVEQIVLKCRVLSSDGILYNDLTIDVNEVVNDYYYNQSQQYVEINHLYTAYRLFTSYASNGGTMFLSRWVERPYEVEGVTYNAYTYGGQLKNLTKDFIILDWTFDETYQEYDDIDRFFYTMALDSNFVDYVPYVDNGYGSSAEPYFDAMNLVNMVFGSIPSFWNIQILPLVSIGSLIGVAILLPLVLWLIKLFKR